MYMDVNLKIIRVNNKNKNVDEITNCEFHSETKRKNIQLIWENESELEISLLEIRFSWKEKEKRAHFWFAYPNFY